MESGAGLQSQQFRDEGSLGAIPIGVCQLESDIGQEDYDPRPANFERAVAAIAVASAQGAKLLVFGEVYLNGYETGAVGYKYALAEREDDPWVARLIEQACAQDVHILMGATTHKGTFPGDLYNSVLVVGPTGLIGVYSKTHLTAFMFDETRPAAETMYWRSGHDLPIFEMPFGRVGIEICYDLLFPEVARTLALKGADLIVNVSAAISGREEWWDHFLYVRAIENRIWYLHVSVVGRQKDFEFFGGSRLFSPSGEIVASAPRHESAVIVASASREELLKARATLHPFRDRNPVLYGPICDLRPPELTEVETTGQ